MKNQADTPRYVADDGRVRTGAISPAFPPVRATPSPVRDDGKTQMGAISPAFPPRG